MSEGRNEGRNLRGGAGQCVEWDGKTEEVRRRAGKAFGGASSLPWFVSVVAEDSTTGPVRCGCAAVKGDGTEWFGGFWCAQGAGNKGSEVPVSQQSQRQGMKTKSESGPLSKDLPAAGSLRLQLGRLD